MPGGQGLDDAVLGAVGVLVLVDQQVVETPGLGRADLGKPRKKLLGQQEQVIEIDRAGRLQRPLIAAVGRRGQMLLVGLGHGDRFLGPDRTVLPAADEIEQVARLEQRPRPP